MMCEFPISSLPPTPSIVYIVSDTRAGELLARVNSAVMAVVNAPQRARRINAGAKGGIRSPREALREVAADCTWEKAFGTPEGVLPARPGPPPPHEGGRGRPRPAS